VIVLIQVLFRQEHSDEALFPLFLPFFF